MEVEYLYIAPSLILMIILELLWQRRSGKVDRFPGDYDISAGGHINLGESIINGAIRECHEELGNEAMFDSNQIELVMEFDEIATSDGKTPIHFYVFKYNGLLEGKLNISEEIENFKWYESVDGTDILSNTLKNEVIPYCLKNNLIK